MTAGGDDWAAEVVQDCAERSPEVLELAMVVSLAARVEPVLLRRARFELCPWVHAGAESELWHGPLVQARSPKAMVFDPAVAGLLQRLLRKALRPDLDSAWRLLTETHANLPEAVRLEEEVTWRALRDPSDPEIEVLLRKAVRTLVETAEPDLADWAARAVPRLPEEVQRIPEAWFLALAANFRLRGPAAGEEAPIPLGVTADDAFWAAAARKGRQAQVYLRRLGSEICLSLQPWDGEVPLRSVSVPLTQPVLLEITTADGPELIALRPEDPEPAKVSIMGGGLRLRTAAGEVYRVEVPFEEEVSSAPKETVLPSPSGFPFQSMAALPPGSQVFVGRNRILQGILEGLTHKENFLIIGPRRIGKTSLLNRIAYEFRDRPQVRVLRLDCQGASTADDLRSQLPFSDKRDGVQDLLREFVFDAAQEGQRLLFLLNEIDALLERDPSFVSFLRSLSEEAEACFVVTGHMAARHRVVDPRSPLFHWLHGLQREPAVVLGSLEPEAGRELLNILERPEIGLRWAQGTRQRAQEMILDRTYRIGWLLQEVCLRLVEKVTEAEIGLQDLEAVLFSLPSMWEELEADIERLTRSIGPPNIHLAARFGLQLLASRVEPDLVFGIDLVRSEASAALARVLGRPGPAWTLFEQVPFAEFFAALTDNTLVLRQQNDAAGHPIGYSFTDWIYPRELSRVLGGAEAITSHLDDLAMSLIATLGMRIPFDEVAIIRWDSESPAVLWGDGVATAWRFEDISSGSRRSPILTSADLMKGQPHVVLGEHRSGLRSFLGWIGHLAPESDFNFVTLHCSQLPESPPEDALAGHVARLLAGLTRTRAFEKAQDLPTLFETYARLSSRQLVFALAGLEVLTPEAAHRVLGSLRAAIEFGKLRSVHLILAATRLEVFDPNPFMSPFFLGPRYRLPMLTRDEIADLWSRLGFARTNAVADACFTWTGGQPLLVQLFLREAANLKRNIQEIGRGLSRNPPSAVSVWQRDLAVILREDLEAARFFQNLLGGRTKAISSAWSKLFVAGWIRRETERSDTWVIRSQAHAGWARAVLDTVRDSA